MRWIHYLPAGAQRALRLLDKAVTHGSARYMFVQREVVRVHSLRLFHSVAEGLILQALQEILLLQKRSFISVLLFAMKCSRGIGLVRMELISNVFGDLFCFHHHS
jgi:hypothetical protein